MTIKDRNHLPNRVSGAIDILLAIGTLVAGVTIFLVLFPFALLWMVGMGVWELSHHILKK